METYNYYLVMEVDHYKNEDPWMVACFTNYDKAVEFANHYIPREDSLIEIFGTNEDPNTYITCVIVYARNPKTGDLIKLGDLSGVYPKAVEIALKLAEDGEPIEAILASLTTVSGCLDRISYLLDRIKN